jgi:hypothetical protein
MTTTSLAAEKQQKKRLKIASETKIAIKWFLDSGLCVNKNKTEVCVFFRNNSRAHEVVLGSEKVSVLKNMKILGLIFDSKLNWYRQTVTAIEKTNKAKQALRIISRYFLLQKMFISLLADITTPTSYKDDNYLFGSRETAKKALENCIKETKIAMIWFLNTGLCVNKKKTEIVNIIFFMKRNILVLVRKGFSSFPPSNSVVSLSLSCVYVLNS